MFVIYPRKKRSSRSKRKSKRHSRKRVNNSDSSLITRFKLNPDAKPFKPSQQVNIKNIKGHIYKSKRKSPLKSKKSPLKQHFSPNRDTTPWINPVSKQSILFLHTTKNIPKSFYKI